MKQESIKSKFCLIRNDLKHQSGSVLTSYKIQLLEFPYFSLQHTIQLQQHSILSLTQISFTTSSNNTNFIRY